MFWKFNLLTSNIDTLLDKEDLTLHEILDEDDVLQEVKSQNKRLIDFLILPANIEELVNYITQEPSDDTDEKLRYKYPNTACELLISDVSQITDKVAGDAALMAKVYGFLENEGPLNPLLASFFSKVMGLLISRKSEMMLEFLRSKEDFVGHLLRHLGTSAIMDLLLRLITCIESSECHMMCLRWLSEMQLIQKLVAMIDPVNPEEKHCNACQSLCDIIKLSREQMSQLQEKADPDPLLSTMESEETIMELLKHMFDGEKVESVLVNGITIIQNLLEFKRLGMFLFHSPDGGSEPITSLDAERLAHSVSNTVRALTPRLKDFHQILLDPPKQHYTPMRTTIGELSPPFGNTRLQTTKLITSLLFTKTESVNNELASLGTFPILLDLCFKYMWNNFLHAQVEQSLSSVLGGSLSEEEGEGGDNTDNPLLSQLLKEYKIIEKILEVWEDNEQQQLRPGGHRRGYMGHLTKMANHITTNMEKGPNCEIIKKYFDELPQESKDKWNSFVSGSLAEINKQNTVELVSMAGGQNLYSSSEDDDPEFRDITFPQDTAMQQAFADYQLQQMTSNFIDQFGFNEEDFGESEERVSEKFKDRISSINFDINTDEITNAGTLFDQVCNERIQQFEDQESEEDLWEEKEITFSQSSDSRQNSASRSAGGRLAVPPTATPDSDEEQSDSSDSEEELDSPRQIHQKPTVLSPHHIADSTNTSSTATTEKMDVDNSDNWANFDDISMETGTTLSTTDPGNWAKFDSDSSNNTHIQVPSESNAKTWTDFSNTSESGNVNSSDIDDRSRSPVAMDTNETSSSSCRTAAYLVSSAPADLACDIGQSTDLVNVQSNVQQSPSASPERLSSSDISLVSPTASSSVTTTDISSSTQQASPDSQTPDSSSDGISTLGTNPPRDITIIQPLPDITSSPEQSDKISPSSANEADQSAVLVSSSQVAPVDEQSVPSSSCDMDEEEEDLGDNFNFLAASGLMKCTDVPSSCTSTEKVQGDSSPQPDTTADNSKLEEMRAQAKQALDQFTAATSGSANSSQNGPV